MPTVAAEESSKVRTKMSGEAIYVCQMDDATRERARRELNENEEQSTSQLDALKIWVKGHPYMMSRTDDAFLLRFLRISKFSLLAAQQRLEKFCVVRSSECDGEAKWFERQVAEECVIQCLLTGWIYQLPGVDDEGRIICVVKYGNFDHRKYDIDMMFRCVFMFFDTIQMDERAQINGIIILDDAKDITLSHLKPFTPDVIKRAQNVWQEVYPIRLKAIHYINLPTIFKTFLEVAQTFLKDKYKDRIFYHDKNIVIKEMIPQRMLPTELGGDAGPETGLVETTIENLKHNADEYDRLKHCRVDDGKRPRQEPQGDSWGMVGSFRKINT